MLKRCVGAVSLLMVGALLAPSSSSAESSTGWTSPMKTSGVAEWASNLSGSSAGLAYGGYDGVVYRPSGATDSTIVKDAFLPMVSGSSLIALHQPHLSQGELEFIDLRTGATSTVPGAYAEANLGGVALSSAGSTNPTRFTLTHSDGSTETITIPVAFVYDQVGNDANGFAFWSANASLTKYALYYYDLNARTYRELQAGDGDVRSLAVTPRDVVWLVNNVVYRVPRAGGPIAQSQAPTGATGMTATDNLTAFLVKGAVIVRTPAGDSNANVPTADTITTDGTNVLVASHTHVETAGIYQVTPTGAAQELFPLRRMPYSVLGLAFSLGHVYYADNSAADSPWFTRPVGSGPPNVDVGGESGIGFRPGSAVTSGDRVAFDQKVSGVWHVKVMRNGRLERDYVTSGEAHLQMSGPWLLMPSRPDMKNIWSTKLANVSTGAVTTIAENADQGSLWGPVLVYVDNKDNLWRRDLTKSVSSTNPRLLLTPKQYGRRICCPQVWGDWVELNNVLINFRTGERLSIARHGQLSDGAVAWFDTTGDLDTNAQTRVMRLSGTDRTQVGLGTNAGQVSVVEDKFAWIDLTTGLLHVDQLPFNGTDVPRALYLTPTRTFTPNGKRHYVVELDSTKALKTWAIEIRGPHGALIHRWTGSGLNSGVVKVGWDGTSASGHRVGAGTYTVKATGVAADGSGALRRAFGSKLPLSWIAVTYPR